MKKSRLATAALVLGIIALIPILGMPFAIGAFVCGLWAYVRIRASGGMILGKGRAVAGMILAVAACVGSVMAFFPLRESFRLAACNANLKSIELAIHLYNNDHNTLPSSWGQLMNGVYLSKDCQMIYCPDAENQKIPSYRLTDLNGLRLYADGAESVELIIETDQRNHGGRTAVIYGDLRNRREGVSVD